MSHPKPNSPGRTPGCPEDPPPPYSTVPGQPYYQPPPQQSSGPPPNFYQGYPKVPTAVIVVESFGPYPQTVYCRKCRTAVESEVLPVPGFLTWVLSGGLFLLGCWAGCCLIPCCIPECQDMEHRCPSCKTRLGFYRRI